MLVIGLHGWILPPALILLCDFVGYSEFLFHPAQLLISSTQLRAELLHIPLSRLLVSKAMCRRE
jgi:hypothetical protein